MIQAAAPPDPDAEQEIDLASAWERITTRWWLPVAGLAAGAVVGLVLAFAGGSVWRAQTIVYLGQPFAPLGGGQIQTLATNPRTVGEIVRSEAVLDAASEASDVSVSELRSSISTKEIITTGQPRGITPLIEITVKANTRRKAERALTTLAERVVGDVSLFVEDKIELYEGQLRTARTQLAAVEARIQDAQRQQDQLIRDTSIPLDQRLLLSANLNSVITTADARRASLQENLYEAEQLLNLAETVEKSRIVEQPTAAKTTARSSQTSLVVGALIGLVLGIVAALAAEPIVARRRRSGPAR